MSTELVVTAKTGLANIISLARKEISKVQDAAKSELYSNTNYELPLVFALRGDSVKSIDDVKKLLDTLENEVESAAALEDVGRLTLCACDCLYAAKASTGASDGPLYSGFIADSVLRELGVFLVDGSINGIAVIACDKSRDAADVAELVRKLQQQDFLTLIAGDIVPGLNDAGVKLGLTFRTVALGKDLLSVTLALNLAMRVALTFGGVERGEEKKACDYLKNRFPGFAVVLNAPTAELVAVAGGTALLGIPIISDVVDEDIPPVLYKATSAVECSVKGSELRSIKSRAPKISLPVAFGHAFEGERIRRQDMHFEGGGQKTASFELVVMRDGNDVEDGKVELIGPDVDKFPEGSTNSFAFLIEVAGKKMQTDFEPVLERRVHNYVNYAEGVWHSGQREQNWLRVGKDALAKGVRFAHLGEVFISKFKDDFASIVDKVQVTIITDAKEVDARLPEAMKKYAQRDKRISDLTDESVDTFYSCTLCQSFAPDHVCIISPERLGLCGALNWLDAKAGYEVVPTGPNQPIKKTDAIDAKAGQWNEINAFVHDASHGKIERVSLYSIMRDPMTSCGCFEVIAGLVPEANGVFLVNREFTGDTPLGMRFSTLAGTVGGGNQTPGFMGIGKRYITSPKFLFADGGLARIVWMPKQLKEMISGRFLIREKEAGYPGLLDKIADETQAKSVEDLLAHLEKKSHPVLGLDPII